MLFRYIIKRILMALPVMFAVATIVFALIHVIPGDPIDFILGEQALSIDRAQLAKELHLDEPLGLQYAGFLTGIVSGNWGKSLFDRRPVILHIRECMGATIILAACALAISLLVAIPLGVLSAVKSGGVLDHAAMIVALTGISVPTFWLGPVLILVFSVWLEIFPISGRESLASIILPALTLGLVISAMLSRLTRASMIDELLRDYVTTARAKGLSEHAVVMRHVFRNALNPVISIIGLECGSLLAGTIITERVFGWPGVGMLLLDSISRRDYPLVQGCVLVIAFTYVTINAITDCLYQTADPRVKL